MWLAEDEEECDVVVVSVAVVVVVVLEREKAIAGYFGVFRVIFYLHRTGR
jgi:hypothetical protein